MKKFRYLFPIIAATLFAGPAPAAQEGPIEIEKMAGPGRERPILVSLSGFTGEAAQVIQFDLSVQGFAVSDEQSAQYLISGSNNGNLQGKVTDHINKNVVLAKAYSGASPRRQAHAFIDDFVQALGR